MSRSTCRVGEEIDRERDDGNKRIDTIYSSYTQLNDIIVRAFLLSSSSTCISFKLRRRSPPRDAQAANDLAERTMGRRRAVVVEAAVVVAVRRDRGRVGKHGVHVEVGPGAAEQPTGKHTFSSSLSRCTARSVLEEALR